jgi:hypothetical protein
MSVMSRFIRGNLNIISRTINRAPPDRESSSHGASALPDKGSTLRADSKA